MTVNTHCAQIHTETGETREENRKGLQKEVKTTLEGKTATGAELHAGSQGAAGREQHGCLPRRTTWKRLKKTRLSQGAPLHACRPDEQVENKAESSWSDLAKQGNPNQALVCL